MDNIKTNNDFIFDSIPLDEEFDMRLLSTIQESIEDNGYINKENIPAFLNWIVYKTRKNICFNQENIIDTSYAGRSNRAVAYINALLNKLKIKNFCFNIGDVLGTGKIHSVSCLFLTVLDDLEIKKECYILDPTFRQFCTFEENRFERYFESPRWSLKLSTPHPGYFLNLYDDGKKFANNLIKYGYFNCDDNNVKIYFDAFVLYATPKEYYESDEDIGKVWKTGNSGKDYFDAFIKIREDIHSSLRDFEFQTPNEYVEAFNKKILHKLKYHNSDVI